MKNNNQEKIIVSFHIGRGGEEFKERYLSYIGERPISYYTEDLGLRYLNHLAIIERLEGKNYEEKFNRLLMLLENKRTYELTREFNINENELKDVEYYDQSNGMPVGLTLEEASTGIGKITFHKDYNITYCKYVKDCNEEELNVMINTDDFKSPELIEYLSTIKNEKNE